ncbi:Uncharacterised protein [Mycobacteroides abscessus subsp. abscessus]|nr:Uncharacterised protein [Mycobacteroides abscessus subsp. abscessus]
MGAGAGLCCGAGATTCCTGAGETAGTGASTGAGGGAACLGASAGNGFCTTPRSGDDGP